MKKVLYTVLFFFTVSAILPVTASAQGKSQSKASEFFELRVYHGNSAEQVQQVENYLKQALVPALHKNGIKAVGVFTQKGIDTATDKRIYVLVPYKTLDQFAKLPKQLEKDKSYMEAGKDYINAAYKQPPYARYETILLRAFEMMPFAEASKLTGPKSDRVYELRSYEGHSEKIFQNKVQMFNQGGEVALFKRLGFNAVFYGEVIAGSRMPNLMYMTTFENMAARDEHWKTFGNDPEWKKLSSMPEYQNNVSKGDTWFLTPTEYSDL
jgi:hypothetical protein